MAEVQGSVSIP